MMGEIETVARAICKAAGREVRKTTCSMCEYDAHQNPTCQLWKSFREEARAARTAFADYRRVASGLRLAVLYMTGSWPKAEVDHDDLDKSNNRWLNLREATRAQNLANRRARNKLGIKGVSLLQNGKFRARITIKGKSTYLGCFATAVEAKAVYDATANQNHGAFARSA